MFVCFFLCFLKHGNYYSYQILSAASNSCLYHFTFYNKEVYLQQTFKKLAGKNTVLTKFHVNVHLMTSVDREGIVSKNTCGNFNFMPLLKSYDNFRKFASYHTSKNTAVEHKL